jgi:hypothetical protein
VAFAWCSALSPAINWIVSSIWTERIDGVASVSDTRHPLQGTPFSSGLPMLSATANAGFHLHDSCAGYSPPAQGRVQGSAWGGQNREHDLSRSTSLEITTRSERWANLQRRPSSSRPSVRLRRAKCGLSQRRRRPEGLGHHWVFGASCPSSGDLRHIAGLQKGGSGSSVIEIMRHAVDAASDGLRLSGA